MILRTLLILAAAASVSGGEPHRSGGSRTAGSHTLTEEKPWFDATWRERVAPLISDTCADCHGGDEILEGDLDLTKLEELPARDGLRIIHRLRRRVADREMPPADFAELTSVEIEGLVGWADAALGSAANILPLDPGTVPIRKLSRTEYDRTVRDLFGVTTPKSGSFPPDTARHGFDNVGTGAFSALHLEKYHAAAVDLAARLIDTADPDRPETRRVEAEWMDLERGAAARGERVAMYSNSTASTVLQLPREGRYRIKVSAFAMQAGPELAKVALSVDRKVLGAKEVDASFNQAAVVAWDARLAPGQRLGISFVNDYYKPQHKDPKLKGDRNLMPDWVEIIGPLDERPPPATAGWFFLRDPERGSREPMRLASVVGRARPMVTELLRRTWRRPPSRGDVTTICRLVKEQVAEGACFHEGLRVAVTAALASPRFLFRIESGSRSAKGPQELDPWAVATRLSYGLWGSAPDASLLEAAAEGGLQDRDSVLAAARRMLKDPRSDALVTNFAAQWLELPNLIHAEPDPGRFPGFDAGFAAELRAETEGFLLEARRRGLPVPAFLTAPFTVLSPRLAAHYGLEAEFAPEQRQALVELPTGGMGPGGLLRHGSILLLTSNATRTSPVKRGKWVLENLLDAPPPPPPPGFDSLGDEAGAAASAATLREELAKHRADPNCAVCHQRMDAIGLALESFDPLGRWRDEDGGQPVDTRAELPGGRELEGPRALARWLAEGDTLVKTVLRRYFVFAVGRDTTVDDLLALELVFRRLPEQPTLDDVVLGVVGMDAFWRRGVASEEKR